MILYASYSFTVSGYLAPVYTKLTGNSLVIESNGGSTLNVGEAKSLPDKTLKTETNHLDSADEPINFLREIRSTYAPRTATVRLTRFVDIFIKTLNLSFVDTFIKPLIIEKSRASINPYVGKKAIIAVLAFVAALSIISLLFAYWLVDRETKPFLVIFFVSAICFSSIYNRSDIVNSLAVLSSIVVSNLTIIGWTKRRNIYFLLALFPAIVIGMGASINAVTGFNLIYPFEKRAVMQTSKVIEAINKVVGGYKEEVYLLVHEQSLLSGPFLNYDVYQAHQDISHANIWYYQDEFARTARGKRYLVGTMFDVETSKELPKHFRIMLVKFKPDFKTIGELDEAELIYVNEQNKITRLSM